jgi:hypothetical protein
VTITLWIFVVLTALLALGLTIESRRLERQLHDERARGHRDTATGLGTRAVFLERLLAECKRAERRRAELECRLLQFDDARALDAAAAATVASLPFPGQAFRAAPSVLALLLPRGAQSEALALPTAADRQVVEQFIAGHGYTAEEFVARQAATLDSTTRRS